MGRMGQMRPMGRMRKLLWAIGPMRRISPLRPITDILLNEYLTS